MTAEIIGAIKERLDRSNKILIASHIRPDGDAIGSLLGLGLALINSGKSVKMILVDGVPASFRHLEGSELIVRESSGEHDTFIAVDCADFRRVGKVFEGFGQPDINIDHHKTNEKFGKLNLIEPEEVATSAILASAAGTAAATARRTAGALGQRSLSSAARGGRSSLPTAPSTGASVTATAS